MTEKEIHETKVLVGMSGGIQSQIVVSLLKSQGYQVSALHLRYSKNTAPYEKFKSRCLQEKTSSTELAAFCKKLDVSYQELDVSGAFQQEVIDDSIHESLLLRVPNPCVRCHCKINLSHLVNKATELGYDYAATGHNSVLRTEPMSGKVKLFKGANSQSDQSYFLFELEAEQLRKLMFPLGGLSGDLVKKLAQSFQLEGNPSALSASMCLTSSLDFGNYIDEFVSQDMRPLGVVRFQDGTPLQEHRGMHRFRVGQTIEVGNAKEMKRFHVLGFDRGRCDVIVGNEEQLKCMKFGVTSLRWFEHQSGIHAIQCQVRFSPLSEPLPCKILLQENNSATVLLNAPFLGVSPGNAVTFYREDEVLGGGYIAHNLELFEKEALDKKKKT